jgi:hypothetical protein
MRSESDFIDPTLPKGKNCNVMCPKAYFRVALIFMD